MPASFDVDEFDILSAVWILSCNDENPVITYDGLKFRLGIPESVDIRAIVARRAELFRKGLSDSRLQKWKDEMFAGIGVPGWIKALNSEEDKFKAINSLSSHSVFRSQFRAPAGAEKSPVEIINWGLQHIDRLRKAKLEARDVSAKAWQIWLVFGTAVTSIVVQIVIAAITAHSKHSS